MFICGDYLDEQNLQIFFCNNPEYNSIIPQSVIWAEQTAAGSDHLLITGSRTLTRLHSVILLRNSSINNIRWRVRLRGKCWWCWRGLCYFSEDWCVLMWLSLIWTLWVWTQPRGFVETQRTTTHSSCRRTHKNHFILILQEWAQSFRHPIKLALMLRQSWLPRWQVIHRVHVSCRYLGDGRLVQTSFSLTSRSQTHTNVFYNVQLQVSEVSRVAGPVGSQDQSGRRSLHEMWQNQHVVPHREQQMLKLMLSISSQVFISSHCHTCEGPQGGAGGIMQEK